MRLSNLADDVIGSGQGLQEKSKTINCILFFIVIVSLLFPVAAITDLKMLDVTFE